MSSTTKSRLSARADSVDFPILFRREITTGIREQLEIRQSRKAAETDAQSPETIRLETPTNQ